MVTNDDINYIYTDFDFDVFHHDCDTRISLNEFGIPLIKYVLNTFADIVVIKNFNLKGSASMGDYSITLSADSIISGGVGLNNIVDSQIIYKKKIVKGIFDYTVSNCSFAGLIADYRQNLPYPLDAADVVTGAGLPIDNDMLTYQEEHHNSNAFTTVWETNFSSLDIIGLHAFISLKQSPVNDRIGYYQIQIYDDSSSWVTIFGQNTTFETYQTYCEIKKASYTGVTKIRVQVRTNYSNTSVYTKIFDISVIV